LTRGGSEPDGQKAVADRKKIEKKRCGGCHFSKFRTYVYSDKPPLELPPELAPVGMIFLFIKLLCLPTICRLRRLAGLIKGDTFA
jgi:hypothetical protein